MNEVTQLLDAVSRGEANAAERLLPLVYEELRRLARVISIRKSPGIPCSRPHSFMKHISAWLADDVDAQWQGRSHFLATAALAMRRYSHRQCPPQTTRQARRRTPAGRLGDHADPRQAEADRLLALDEALTRLAGRRCHGCRTGSIAHLWRVSVEEAGKNLGLSRAAAYRQWAFARAWLRCELDGKSLRKH